MPRCRNRRVRARCLTANRRLPHLLGRVKRAKPQPVSIVRVADLGSPLALRTLPDDPQLGLALLARRLHSGANGSKTPPTRSATRVNCLTTAAAARDAGSARWRNACAKRLKPRVCTRASSVCNAGQGTITNGKGAKRGALLAFRARAGGPGAVLKKALCSSRREAAELSVQGGCNALARQIDVNQPFQRLLFPVAATARPACDPGRCQRVETGCEKVF